MANAAPRFGRKCPKGHHMDPNWVTCPYCESEQRARERSGAPEGVASSGGRRTAVGEAPQRGDRRETKVMPPAVESQASGYAGAGEARRIMGALVTYTWHPEGQLFPVREGKTFIGSGDISSEAFHRSCDVQIPDDRRMSSEHALILCRHGAYEIIDQASSNGTFLNGKMLKANDSTEIPNYAKIQTGSTVWTFIHIEAPHEITVQNSTSRDEPPEPDPGRGRDRTIVR
jgi:hypothetical protein